MKMRWVANPLAVTLIASFAALAASNAAHAGMDKQPTAFCPVPDLVQDYARVFGKEPAEIEPFARRTRLSEAGGEILFTDASGCGSMGCEWAIYQRVGKRCYRSLGLIGGHVEVLTKMENGYHQLQSTMKADDASGARVSIYSFDPSESAYVRVFSSEKASPGAGRSAR